MISGCLLSLFLPIVPALLWLIFLFCLILICIYYRLFFVTGFCCALSLWLWQVQQHQSHTEQLLSMSTPWLTGQVASIRQQDPQFSRFLFQINEGSLKGYLLRLRWQEAPHSLGQGQSWWLKLSCKAVKAPANPGSVNVEANAYVSEIIGNCAVKEGLLLDSHWDHRQQLYQRLLSKIGDLPSFSLITALTLGERPFSDELWLGLQATALGHLISISGFHIGLLFGWVYALVIMLSRLHIRLLYCRSLAPFAALAAAWYYSLLAGFAIPTLRALVAMILAVYLIQQRRRLSYSQSWILVCGLLLLLNPLWVMSISFWLTLYAVALIFLFVWRYPLKDRSQWGVIKHALKFQALMTLLMSAPTLLFFHGIAPLALLSNLLFVPWCSLLVIPYLLFALLLELILPADMLWHWQLAELVLSPLHQWLLAGAAMDYWWLLPAQTVFSACCVALLLIAWFFLPAALPRPRLALLMLPFVALLWSKTEQWQLHMIDVGQGTAILLQKGDKGLLYDVGPVYGSFNATEAYVLPYLHFQGIRQLDYLVLSHADSDHTGAFVEVINAYPKLKLIADFDTGFAQQPCSSLPAVYLDALLWSFRSQIQHQGGNNSSCVVAINTVGWQSLLTGDIGHSVEMELMQLNPNLRTDLLLLGHHGSRSSSHLDFLSKLKPLLALNSAASNNAYGHPSKEVLGRLALLQIPLLNTAEQGAVRIEITARQLNIWPYRQQPLPFWLQKQ
ncbi:MAG: DNA internalization-related competence protein ComEC/Rec2 [Pararheinheimera sp.]|nr:DNA internalization-related competence protein ComEC/Rec2 [Rheinheimera sp.]